MNENAVKKFATNLIFIAILFFSAVLVTQFILEHQKPNDLIDNIVWWGSASYFISMLIGFTNIHIGLHEKRSVARESIFTFLAMGTVMWTMLAGIYYLSQNMLVGIPIDIWLGWIIGIFYSFIPIYLIIIINSINEIE